MDFGREEIWKRVGIFALFMTVLFSGLIYWSLQNNDEHYTSLLVKSDVPGGRIYAEGSGFLGYTNRLITNIPPGVYRITARKEGYQALPPSLEIDLPPDSQLTVYFDFKKIRSELMGFLKVVAEHPDSKIFIDDVYYGLLSDKEVIELDSGKYEVSITREGYVGIPPERFVTITAGDTSVYAIQQVQIRSNTPDLSTAYTKNVGSIEVSSNISGAEIILDGRNTGEYTDHVFTQIPPGNYSVMVKKEGYLIEPEVREITISREKPAGAATFTLKKNLEMVTIRTIPPAGKIFIDGNGKGVGEFKGMLAVGEHQLSFGDVPGYVKPRPRQINVTAGIPLDLSVKYFPHMEILATVNTRGTVSEKNCTVTTGYTFKDRAFTASSEGGPTIEFKEDLNGYFWKLGYAFAYRNPRGNDAVKLTFELPRELDYDQKFTFKLYGASSKEKYPLSISSSVEINIKLNNNVLSYYYSPKFIEDLGEVEVKEWDISPYIRGGVNTLEISTTDKNNTFYYLKKLEIFN
jgi:hypothetical protein